MEPVISDRLFVLVRHAGWESEVDITDITTASEMRATIEACAQDLVEHAARDQLAQVDREESLRDDAPAPRRLVDLAGCTTPAERWARLEAIEGEVAQEES